jgi:hypothetical protein
LWSWHWVAPLGLPEGPRDLPRAGRRDPRCSVLDHARLDGVDHIVIGAQTQSLRRRVLGIVSRAVAAEAPCSVTGVRAGLRDQEA